MCVIIIIEETNFVKDVFQEKGTREKDEKDSC